ncbi:hypothetical protein JCM3765_003565 [Sporobolomyces pararoseus]
MRALSPSSSSSSSDSDLVSLEGLCWNPEQPHQLYKKLYELVQYLNIPNFVHRSFDSEMQEEVKRKIRFCEKALTRYDYSMDHPAHSHLQQAIVSLTPTIPKDSISLKARIKASKLLLDAIETLATLELPLPNQHLPTDILHLIFDHVTQFEDPFDRRDTIYALAQTSVAWSRIALKKCQSDVFIGSYRELENWEELYLKGTFDDGEEERQYDLFTVWLWGCIENRDPEIFERVLRRLETKAISVKLEQYTELDDGWWEAIDKILDAFPHNYSFSVPLHDSHDYQRALHSFIAANTNDSTPRRELFFTGQAMQTPTQIVRDMFTDDFQNYSDGSSSCTTGAFLGFQILSAPFLALTVPLFLLLPIKKGQFQLIRSSKIEHLEITLEFDPSNPEQAQYELETFFKVISPTIRHLSLRIRLTTAHPSLENYQAFTDQLASGLLSCSHLSHFELGGFGYSMKQLFSTLPNLPFRTLTFLPRFPDFSDFKIGQFLEQLEPSSTLSKNLQELICVVNPGRADENLKRVGTNVGITVEFHLNGGLEEYLVRDAAESIGVSHRELDEDEREASMFSW